jgi:hypothetical protein
MQITTQVCQSVYTFHGEYVKKHVFFYPRAKKLNNCFFENLFICKSVVICLVSFYVDTFVITYILFSSQLQTYPVLFVLIGTCIQYYPVILYRLGTCMYLAGLTAPHGSSCSSQV